MTDNFSDLHHKMCKKVAQLTKVIFFLNTKNDEYEQNLKAVVLAYETQLDSTLKEANSIIGKYKEALDKASKNDELGAQVSKMKATIDQEKAAS